MVLTARGRCYTFYRRLAAMVDSHRFATYTKLKVVRGGQLADTSEAKAARIRGGRTLPRITSLELSFDPSDATPESIRDRRWYPEIETKLWEAVAEYLPNLVHLTVSHDMVAGSSAQAISNTCPNLTSLAWRNQAASPFMCDTSLGNVGVSCIDMDGSTFCLTGRITPGDGGPTLFDEGETHARDRCIFQRYVDQLERVSLRHARYYVAFPNDAQPIPQRGLIKFVRRATNLRWFRSDLTPENVAMLQLERPDVTFVS
jgi:hypothetical protein